MIEQALAVKISAAAKGDGPSQQCRLSAWNLQKRERRREGGGRGEEEIRG